MLSKLLPVILVATFLFPTLPVPAAGPVGAAAARTDKRGSGTNTRQKPALSSIKTLSSQEIKSIQEKLKAFEHLKVEFTQSTYRSLRKKTSLTKGRAYFSRPDRFRWILDGPEHDEWIFDGHHLIHFIPERKEAVSYGSGARKGKELRQIVDMVLNFENLLKTFQIRSSSRKEGIASIILAPLKKSGEIRQADLTIDLGQDFIRVLKLEFRHGNHTILEFSQAERKSIRPDTYRLPKGIRISKVL